MTTYSWLLLIEELEAINTSAIKIYINHKNRFKRVFFILFKHKLFNYDRKKYLKKLQVITTRNSVTLVIVWLIYNS